MGIAVNSSGYVSQASQIADGVITWAKMLGTDVSHGGGYITLLGMGYDSIVQGTWVNAADTSQFLCGSFRNPGTSANGDGFTWKVYLAKGDYSIVYSAIQTNSSGIAKIKNGTTTLATFDNYCAAAVTYNVLQTGSFTQATSGLVTLTHVTDGKNAGSSSYLINFSGMILYRTA